MLSRAFVAVVALAFSSPAVPETPLDYVNYPLIEQIVCAEGKGTGFIAGGRVISANHVTSLTDCTMRGKPVNMTAEGGDFSSGPSAIKGYKIDCGGFRYGETVWAIGYADGLPFQRRIALVVSNQRSSDGMVALIGHPTVIPGMSGGPIFNAAGEVVGIVNRYHQIFPISISRELRGTSLCK